MQTLNIKVITYALTTLAAAAYAVCALFRPLFPTWAMYDVTLWQALFPGFSWTWSGVVVGLLWTVGYAVFAAVVFVTAYNFFAGRQFQAAERRNISQRDLPGHT